MSSAGTPAFDRLSPALQYHVVNALGWRSLRPVQEQAVHAIMDGANCAVLAPTAGGKTEAALLPALSLIDRGDWPSPSVLYIAPIRALLNNLAPRLERLSGLLGRRSFVWHGDIGFAARRRALGEGVDLIAITPESMEALLLSTRLSARQVLAEIRLVIIDEVHAFAGDDRGAHLVAILERVQRLAGRDLQRVGLSATVGNPAEICAWLSGSSEREQRVVQPAGVSREPELAVDHVGSLENAAVIIERLHPGRKRLVFADSRRRVEKLGHLLTARGVDTYVSHSSLAVSERRAAESAFEQASNCVIVATSALELGIDVGDLDHVLQIDATPTVAGFLQRMGRTGRRPDTTANCTFLATSDDALLQTVALLRLHGSGFVEPIRTDRRAVHLLAHQLMALALQLDGVERDRWWSWLAGTAAFADLDAGDREQLLDHMLSKGILAEVDRRLILGPAGERRYGRRRFQELYAVFPTTPELTVTHGPAEIGTIDRSFLEANDPTTLTFVLAGRPWQVDRVDWRRSMCHVLPAEEGRYPAWPGRPRFLSRELCRSVRQVLLDDSHDSWLSNRARKGLDGIRDRHAFLRDTGPIAGHKQHAEWWTFAGGRANTLLARILQARLTFGTRPGNYQIEIHTCDTAAVRRAIESLAAPESLGEQAVREAAKRGNRTRLSKLQPCLPEYHELMLIAGRMLDVAAAREAIKESAGGL